MTMTTSIVAELHDGPAHRHRQDGSMWYIPPRTGQRLISVTSVFDFIAKEQLDKRWRPGLSAQAAFDELPRVVAASRVKPCGRTNNECDHDFQDRCAACPCGDCKACMIRWLTYRHYAETKKARDRGSAMHHWIENWVKFDGKVSRPDPGEECAPYVASFLRFVEDMGLTPDSWELLETTVLNYTDGWGGTLDGHIRFDATATPKARKVCAKFGLVAPLLTFDSKSREKTDASFWPDNAKQLAAYCRGEVVLLDDGSEEPLPPTDGGLVVQFRPDGYGWRRVDTSEHTYRAFLANRESALWEIEYGAASTQVKSFPDLEIPGLAAQPAKATRRSTPRKAAPLALGATADHPPSEGARLTDEMIPF